VRCDQCGTTLIREALGHSVQYERAASAVDRKIFSGVGAILGFSLVAGLLKFVFTSHWLSDHEIYFAAVVGAVVGGVFGRLLLLARRRVP
jgi:hypothetical protein